MFFTPGEKLIRFRKRYKITQADLAGDDLSRTSLGMIETGKRSLTSNLAKFLEENLTKIFKERGITDKIDMEELLKSKEVQAKEYLNQIMLEDISEITNSMWTIDEAIILINDIDKSYFSKLLYKKYFNNDDLTNAKKYLINYFHYYNERENPILEIIDMMKINNRLLKYRENIDVYETFYSIIYTKENAEYFTNVRVFYAEALYKSNHTNKAIENLMFFMKKAKNENDFYIFRKILCDAYAYSGKYENAIEEYVSLAKGKIDSVKALLYSCVLDIANKTKNQEIMKKFYNRTRDLSHIADFENMEDKYFIDTVLGKIAFHLGKNDESQSFYLNAFEIGKDLHGKIDSQMFLLGSLFDILDVKDFQVLVQLEEEYRKLLQLKEDYRPAIKLIDFYRRNMPIELAEKISLYK